MKSPTKQKMDERIRMAEEAKDRLTTISKWARDKHLASVKAQIARFDERIKGFKSEKAKIKEN